MPCAAPGQPLKDRCVRKVPLIWPVPAWEENFLYYRQTVWIQTQTITTWGWAVYTVKFHRRGHGDSGFVLLYRPSVLQHSHLISICNRTTRSTEISRRNMWLRKSHSRGRWKRRKEHKNTDGKIRFHKKNNVIP